MPNWSTTVYSCLIQSLGSAQVPRPRAWYSLGPTHIEHFAVPTARGSVRSGVYIVYLSPTHTQQRGKGVDFLCFKADGKKVKWSRYRPGVAHRVGRSIALLFHDRGTRRGWVVSRMPRPHFTPGKHPVHILQVAGWAENLVPTRIRSRTVQPVVSRYTDWATGPIKQTVHLVITG